MTTLHSIAELSEVPGPVHLAIGVFDGVHLGHQAVISRALEQPGSAVAVTFDPHPASVLRPDAAPRLILSTPHKVQVLRALGVERLLVIPFDGVFARLEPHEFVAALQTACRPLGSVSVGRDWTFGHRAAGNVALLRSLGLTVHAVDPVALDGEVVSSTLIREAVATGQLERAATLLGRAYSVLGTVVVGRQLGRTIGFPTANLALENEPLPPNGVYAVRGRLRDGSVLPGVANLGLRPTVENAAPERRLEAHFFDVDADLYGQTLELEFARVLRGERKFASMDELKAQIALDATAARDVLGASRA